MIVTVYVVILQLQIKHFPILNLPSFQCFWSCMVNAGFLIGPSSENIWKLKQYCWWGINESCWSASSCIEQWSPRSPDPSTLQECFRILVACHWKLGKHLTKLKLHLTISLPNMKNILCILMMKNTPKPNIGWNRWMCPWCHVWRCQIVITGKRRAQADRRILSVRREQVDNEIPLEKMPFYSAK